MTDHGTADPAHPEPFAKAVLRGGPAGLPEHSRHHLVAIGEDRIKVQYLGGYEHFQRAPRTAEGAVDVVVFQWIGRTKIAE